MGHRVVQWNRFERDHRRRMLARMWRCGPWLAATLAVGCSTSSRSGDAGQSYVSPLQGSQLTVKDVAVGAFYMPVSRAAIRAVVIPPGCTSSNMGLQCQDACPVVDGFEGTYGGAAMEVASHGGPGQNPNTGLPDGLCAMPTLQLDVGADDPVTTNVVELRDTTSTIRATFPIDALQPRHVGSPDGWALCGGKVERLTWDHPADLAMMSNAPKLYWIEYGQLCAEGCVVRGSFEAVATISGDGQLSATIPSGVKLYWSDGRSSGGPLELTVPGALMEGDADTCEGAKSCSYRFSHVAFASTTYTPTCM